MEKCKACGADMRYCAETGDVRCVNCGKKLTIDPKARGKKKSWLIILVAAVLGICLTVFGINIARCKKQYRTAMEAYETEYYATAVAEFADLVAWRNYRLVPGAADSDEQLQKALASLTAYSLEESSFQLMEIVTDVPKNWNPRKMDRLMDILYAAAGDCEVQKAYGAAVVLLEMTEENRDVTEDIRRCHYLAAEQSLAEGDLLRAASNFEMAEGYADSVERAVAAHYTYGVQKLEEGLYGAAYDALAPLGDYEDSKMLVQYCRAMSKVQTDLMAAERILEELPDDYKNVAQLKQQITLFKPFAGEYECTGYQGGLYSGGVKQKNNVYQQYYTLNVVPRYLQLDASSTELTLWVVLEGCYETGGVKSQWAITELELFENSKFSHTLRVKMDKDVCTQWIDLTVSEGAIRFVSHDTSNSGTVDEIRTYQFVRK